MDTQDEISKAPEMEQAPEILTSACMTGFVIVFMRAKARIDKLDPKAIESKIEKNEPKRPKPNTDIADPRRSMLLNERVVPRWI